ncbi:NADH:flavin oxidoreductase/NADH oxidase [Halomonas aestuarii]|uniref:NADH:flavin oxidoreductase/NADH oxidase n=1 Tax=Halomonas aestuarii TaxID=1897729 RepID=UPI0009FA3F9E|nr:NADH:flavin oxidoreductase/NADH oxidase [Halomonas aestuarii]
MSDRPDAGSHDAATRSPQQETLVDSRSGGENARRILRRDPNPHLFRPVQFRSVKARNRIMLSPMCQYSGHDGLSNDWHFVHLGARATGGAGWVFTEAVHVEPRGRITPHCLGLWNNEQRDRLARIAAFVEQQGAVPGIQLGHAGRKASVGRPWEGSHPLRPEQGGWDDLVSASALPYARGWQVPAAMTPSQIDASLESLKASTRRAREAGFKALELHGAHGYLIHQFLSPLSNRREDAYGGSFEHRIRFLLESIGVVREEWPDELPLFLRLSCTDWVEGGWTLDDSVHLAARLRQQGQVDLIDCSSGGNDPRQQIPIHPGYQIPLAQRVRQESGMATGAVGLIHSPDLAEAVIANGQADLVVLGRALLADPAWPLRAAAMLKAENVAWPPQYERSNIF